MKNGYLSIVAELAKKYTGGRSGSLPLETGEQLAEAVLYCVDTFQHFGSGLTVSGADSPEYRYREGLRLVKERVAAAKARYRQITEIFNSYGNVCLEAVIREGIPAFFKVYNPEFEPQNTVLTLDYPVFVDLTSKCGAERIDSFLACIDAEQRFLIRLERNYVLSVLRHRKDAVENICFPVLLDMICRKILQKPLSGGDFTALEYSLLEQRLTVYSREALTLRITAFFDRMTEVQYQNSEQIRFYLRLAAPDLAVRLLNAAKSHTLEHLLQYENIPKP